MKENIKKVMLTTFLAGLCFLFAPMQQDTVKAGTKVTYTYTWRSKMDNTITSEKQLCQSYILQYGEAAAYSFNGSETKIYVQFHDRKKTSSIYYKTDWIEVSRIRKGVNPFNYTYYNGLKDGLIKDKSHDPHQYFTSAGLEDTRYSVRIPVSKLTKPASGDVVKNGYVITTRCVSLDKLTDLIKAKNTNWYNEMTKFKTEGKSFYLGY